MIFKVLLILSVLLYTEVLGFRPLQSRPVSTFSPQLKSTLLMKWLSSSVSMKVPAPIDKTYELYTDLEEHPSWSPWLKDVQYDAEAGLSLWTLKAFGFTFSWHAKNTRVEVPLVLEWKSLDGFPNKGLVEFYSTESDNNDTEVSLTISYYVPNTVASVIERATSINTFVCETIRADLNRFRDRLIKELHEEKEKVNIL
jgi:uncharacterized membrane protein